MMPWRDHRAAAKIQNPLERDAALKRMLGFSEETFTRAAKVLRMNHSASASSSAA
jgi:hypothetical protein